MKEIKKEKRKKTIGNDGLKTSNMVLLQNLKSSFNSRRGSIFGSPPKPWASFSLFLHRLSSIYSSLPFPFLLPRKYFCFPFPRIFSSAFSGLSFSSNLMLYLFLPFFLFLFFFFLSILFFHRYSNFVIYINGNHFFLH